MMAVVGCGQSEADDGFRVPSQVSQGDIRIRAEPYLGFRLTIPGV
ncbi:hypothetical protein HanRHA438_Chr05g0218481 [Helianthus annuus]|uniref:Uncharacterized protein n=1 Tax=Helianthus annuus TaxID=4232 RepID=A0A9K3IYF2_HELAN|nr:hypothetical protein HanXRQr2_Chr05g0208961 [Helianthus annuus]KAJ0584172.1 hypothetical protein HanHA89_Chr05g0185451 [Helianthus annuus]KAJ0630614.1 hypothetical protein HanHA300_Chr00c0175g0724751 [Helianthus annuus]KAJ0749841.1 hypothetical protein HanLR1_Chr05g0174851 [Helianthus annuus]KAJ0918487.1 hypothetical protein HanRHA438_Chr05g0218481 [Helianthus annuus]